jgi:hypothetical protein
MLLQVLRRLGSRRRPLRSRVAGGAELGMREPRCDIMLGEVYCAHAKRHGRNQLLPKDVLPTCPSVYGQAPPAAEAEFACGPYAFVH